jgi:hypothetical protein
MPRGAEEGERGDAVRGSRGLLIISNSREGAAPRGACRQAVARARYVAARAGPRR